MRYEIKRTSGSTERLIATVSPTGKQSKKAMGENVVDFSFTLPRYVDFKLMDFVLVYGERYQLNVLPSVKKTAKNSFEYNMQLEAVFYDLAKVQLQFLNTKNQLLEPSFTLMGNAATIVGLIVENANRHSAGWSVGTVDDTGYKNFTFNGENCLQGLNRLAQEFETEFWIENKTIHLQKREQSSGMSFGYGQGKGLYSIFRGNNKSINIVTRLYVRGSAQNLPAGYRNASGSLLLPGGKTYYEDPAKIALYGLIEATQVFDVKPEREGVVSAVVAGTGNWKFFTDNTLDFDLNTVKLDGASKVRFNTGQLAGYSFEISAYNHQTKQVTLKKNEEEKAIEMPSDLLRPAVGDKYVLVDIAMPESYISAAENRLNQAALAYYEKNSDPVLNFAYTIDCDPIWFKKLGVQVTLGNTVVITDTDMGINGEIRIAAYKRDLQSAYKYEFEVTDSIGANEIIRQYAQQQRTLQLIESSGLLDINQIRKNIFLNRLSEQDGYLMLSGTKTKAGVADYTTEAGHALKADYAKDSDQWDGRHFDDFISQPLRKTDAVTFLSVVADTVNSKGYVSGFTGTGYKINPDGSAEFDNLTVRKELNVNVLNIREITGSGGSIAITNVAKIKTVTENAGYWSCQINTDEGTIAVQLRINDIVRCQVWDGKRLKYYTARVKAVSAGAFDLDKTGKTGGGIPAAGDSVFQFGNTTDTSRQGLIYLTNSDTGAPYIDILDGINSDNLAGKTKVRLGKLSGISDADLGELDGYGLYADRAFIKGKIVVTGGNAETVEGAAKKANIAQTAAAGYTDSKSNAALSAAQTYADNIATVKANTAQANAVYQASNDAQVKADTARDQADVLAQQLVAGIQLGGTNLFRGGSFEDLPVIEGKYNCEPTSVASYGGILPKIGSKFLFAYNMGINTVFYFQLSKITITPNTQYTVSFYATLPFATNTLNITLAYNNSTYATFPVANMNTAINWGRRLSVTFTTPADVTTVALRFDVVSSNWFVLDGLKMSLGNKADDWSPAPEDVQAAINNAKALADQANASYSALTSSLKSLAYLDAVELSKLGSTVIEKGMIKTTLLDVGYLRANVANIAYLQGLEFNFTQGTVDRLKARVINATQIVVDGGGATTTQAQSYANTARDQANVLARQLVSDIQLGGANLYSGGSFETLPVFESKYNCEPTSIPSYGGLYPKIGSKFLFAANMGINTVFYFQLSKMPIAPNTQYTVSFYAMLPFTANTLNITLAYNNGAYVTFPVANMNTDVSWGKRMSVTFTTPASVITVALRFDVVAPNWFALDGLKMSLGNKADDWSPSIEEQQTQINNLKGVTDNFTVINGGVISTNTVKVGTLTQANAGLTGVTDQGADSVRMWAGGTYENRYTANYQVRDNGRIIAKNAEIGGKIVATEGNIGSLRINQSGLAAGSENTWTANSESVVFNPSYLLMRKCGSTAGNSFAVSQTREMSFGLGYYPGSAGSSDNHAVVIKNNIRNTYGSAPPDPSFRHRNIAMRLEARDSDENIALEIGNGRVYLNDVWDVNESTGPLKGYVKAFYNSAWNKYVLVLDDTKPHLEAVTNNNGLYGNELQSGTYQKQCGNWEDVGSFETYTVPANTYFAATKAAANTLAMNDVNKNGQTQADLNGYCQYNPR